MKTYVINLKRSPHRLQFMAAQLDKLQLDFEVVEAVDGQQISDEQRSNYTNGRDMLRGEVACTLSHLKCYELMQRNGVEIALILEDDCTISEPFLKQHLDSWEEKADREKITLLTYFWCREGQMVLLPGTPASHGYSIRSPREIWGVARSGAYIISRESAKAIQEYNSKNDLVKADNWYGYYRDNIISGIDCIYPMPISEAADFGSDIDYVRGNRVLIKKLVDRMVRYKIPVVATWIKNRRVKGTLRYKNITCVD